MGIAVALVDPARIRIRGWDLVGRRWDVMVGLVVLVGDTLWERLGEIARVIESWMSSSGLDRVIALKNEGHDVGREREGE